MKIKLIYLMNDERHGSSRSLVSIGDCSAESKFDSL
jgi:hypothetical protein